MSRKTQVRKPAGNKAWTMEIDPTNALLASLTSAQVPAVAEKQKTKVASNTEQHHQRGAQPSASNGCFSSITADSTTSQARISPLPMCVQFETGAVGGHMLTPSVSHAPCDMTLRASTKQVQVLVTGCVKQQLFRRVKFFDDDLHGNYDYNPESVCGMVRNYCNVASVETNLQWWYETRKKIKRTLGNHRNNCIKAMRLRFRDGETGKINGYQRITGSDDDIAYMLQMRQNQVHYIALMDVFAPCIVSNSVWNNDALMAKYCGDNQDNFQEYVLTISDEAFMLLVLVNYAARWAAELEMEKKMVMPLMHNTAEIQLPLPKYTHSRISRQQQANGGIGWSDDGIAKYNEIYDLVEVDRQLRGNAFNQELLKVHQKRRQKNKSSHAAIVNNERAKKRKPRDDLRKSQAFDRRPEMTPL